MHAALSPYHPVHGKQDLLDLTVLCAVCLPQQGNAYDRDAQCYIVAFLLVCRCKWSRG